MRAKILISLWVLCLIAFFNNNLLAKPSDGFDFPVGKPDGKGYGVVGLKFLDPFDYQNDGFPEYHPGEDWNDDNSGGDPVCAVSNGIVKYAKYSNDDRVGYLVLIEHQASDGAHFVLSDGTKLTTVWSRYQHLASIDAKIQEGLPVDRGDPIGTIGDFPHKSGKAFHLHFEILIQYREPLAFVYNTAKDSPWPPSEVQKYYTNPTQFIKNNPFLVDGGVTDAKLDMNGVVAIWLFDEGKGYNFTDASGNGHDGTFVSGIPKWVEGKFGKALSFDGVADRVETEAPVVMDTVDFTIGCWVNPGKSQKSWASILSTDYIALRKYSDELDLFMAIAVVEGGSLLTLKVQLEAGVWQHLVFVRSGDNGRFYVNGKLAILGKLGSNAPVVIPTLSKFRIGEEFNGMVDEAFIFERALSDDEIVSIMEKGLKSAVPIVLPLTITSIEPSSVQTKDWGESATFTITVKDADGKPVSGAVVVVEDSLQAVSITTALSTTNSSGRVTYTTKVPNGTKSRRYTLTFTASKPGYANSQPVTRRVQVSHADVNGDGRVDILDLVLVAKAFGTSGEGLPADVNGDGKVNISDLVTVAVNFLKPSNDEPAAPQASSLVTRDAASLTLNAEVIEEWLAEARSADDGSETFRRGIAVLESLLNAIVPEKTALFPNYPNPFNPETWIPYQLSEASDVTVTIYDAQGRGVKRLDLGYQQAGIYRERTRAADWDGRNEAGEPVASGVYFVQLRTIKYQQTRRIVLLK